MNYVVKRIVKCDVGSYILNEMISYDDINAAFIWCEIYNNTCCYHKCGCQFQVEEISLETQPLVFTQPIATTTTTYTPYYAYTLPYIYKPYYSNPLWYNSTTTTATGTSFIYTTTT